MKYIYLVIILFYSVSVFAQTAADKKNKALLDRMNKFDDYIFLKTKDSIPLEYANESVVILGQSFSYETSIVEGVYHTVKERIKKRIYLNDKSAVEANSIFYSFSDGSEYPVEVNVVKPSGVVNTLQLKAGVKETISAQTSRSLRSGLNASVSYYKFAIPNLEPGDIIEYTMIHDTKNLIYCQFEWFLNSSYVVLRSQIRMSINPNSSAYYRTLNGAPDFAEKKEGVNTILTLQEGVRPKIGNDWMLPYEKEMPYVKMYVARAPASTPRVNKGVKIEDLHQTIASILPKFLLSQVVSDMETLYPEIKPSTNIEAYIEKCWYLLKYYSTSDDANKAYGYISTYGTFTSYGIPPQNILIGAMAEILTINKQVYDVYLTTTNRESSIENYLWLDNVDPIIKWKGKFIAAPFTSNAYGTLPDNYSGSTAFLVTNFSMKEITRGNSMPFTTVVLPTVNYENSKVQNISVTISGDKFSTTLVKMNTVAKGMPASEEIAEYMNRDFKTEYAAHVKKYTPVDSSKLYLTGKPEKIEENKRKDKETQIAYFKNLNEHYVDLIKEDYPTFEKLESYSFSSSGLLPTSPDFKMEQNFTMQTIAIPAGSGYMIELGILLGDYLKFQEEIRTRNFPGQIYGLNTLEFKIVFQLPAGYKVSTLGDFNKSFEDGLMTFNSTAIIEGNNVIFSVKRSYKKIYFTVEEYKSIVKYYDMMHALKQSKLTIKKI